jgi:outer membrane protein assembly factor BamB
VCWTGASGNAVLGTRAIAVGNLILTLTDTGDAIAFAQDGSEAWRINLASVGEGLLGGLATDGSLVFVGTPTGLVALSATDGSTAWTYTIDPGPQRAAAGVFSPVLAGDGVAALVYTSENRRSVTRRLVSLDRATGTETWSQDIFGDIPAGPLSADDRSIAVAEGDGSIVLRNVADGSEQLRVQVGDLGALAATPIALTRDDFVVGLNTGVVTARFREDGTQRWTMTPASGRVAAVTVNGTYAFINGVTALYSLDAASGTQVWEAPIQDAPPPFAYQTIPAVVDGSVIVGTTDVNGPGALLAFDALSGEPRWRTEVGLFGAIFSPIVSGEWIYAPSFDLVGSGGLLAFGMPG